MTYPKKLRGTFGNINEIIFWRNSTMRWQWEWSSKGDRREKQTGLGEQYSIAQLIDFLKSTRVHTLPGLILQISSERECSWLNGLSPKVEVLAKMCVFPSTFHQSSPWSVCDTNTGYQISCGELGCGN